MKILLVHGVGYEEDAGFEIEWQRCVQERLPGGALDFSLFTYDELFKSRRVDWWNLGGTALELVKSWMEHGIAGSPVLERGLFTLPEATVGMVVKWVQDDDLRATLRDRLKAQIQAERPDLVLAHSLGSLICYDLFARVENAALLTGITWFSFGSQIGHPALCNLFGGQLRVPRGLTHWYAQFNPYDVVFAWQPVDLSADNFTRLDSPFIEPPLNHDAYCYLGADEAESAWRTIGNGAAAAPIGVRALAGSMRVTSPSPRAGASRRAVPRQASRRALIVGINKYALPGMNLEGCLNDAYLMSALLQEQGFDPDDIRMVVDERATADGIRQRIQWLLADTGPQDVRLLYYSGHGVQLPVYGASGKPDHLVESLVPHDFDWSEARTISDKWLATQYGNLPYEAHFIAIFDCCHSGGLSRGGMPMVRSIAPPDDMAHRQLRWDKDWQMWVPRDFVKPSTARMQSIDPRSPVHRLGRGISMRAADGLARRRVARAFGHEGPYMPTILMACQAHERAHEYRHGGGHSYGAFTYALSQVLRDPQRERINTVSDLCEQIDQRLPALGYDQHCAHDGPSAQLNDVARWIADVYVPPKRRR